jgi:predicted nucleotidyltransferase
MKPLPPHLTPAEVLALEEFLQQARALLGPDLLEVRLFGSRARGGGGPDSDLDLALVVTSAGRARRYEVYDLAFDVQLRHGVDVAPLVIEQGRLQELRMSERRIARDIDREGIVL